MKKEMWRLIKSDLGFTLPEIMIGGSILAGVALAGATIFKNQSRSQARIEQEQALSQFHNSLVKTLANDHNCNATMKSFNQFGLSTVGGDFINGIYPCQAGSPTCDTNFNANTVVPGPCLIQEGQWIDDACGTAPNLSKQIWRLSTIIPTNSLTNTSGAFNLRFTYALNPRIGTRTLTKDIMLNLRFNNDATFGATGFQECFSDQESAVNNLQNDVCKSLYSNVGSITSDGALVVWDEKTQSCVLKGTVGSGTGILKDCVTQGLMVAGIRPDGTVHCRTISNGFNPAPVVDGTGCAANSSVKLGFVGSKVKVICVP